MRSEIYIGVSETGLDVIVEVGMGMWLRGMSASFILFAWPTSAAVPIYLRIWVLVEEASVGLAYALDHWIFFLDFFLITEWHKEVSNASTMQDLEVAYRQHGDHIASEGTRMVVLSLGLDIYRVIHILACTSEAIRLEPRLPSCMLHYQQHPGRRQHSKGCAGGCFA